MKIEKRTGPKTVPRDINIESVNSDEIILLNLTNCFLLLKIILRPRVLLKILNSLSKTFPDWGSGFSSISKQMMIKNKNLSFL